ncbi:Transposon Ty3-G Gag-Pol polyprotein [Folsomia candida]|uniref:RNA-directed DNA polymerase n=1 Tax=Folsomia candida TaxID=158441 RepID=A0A226DCW2_FOLCA|nr:Transposon Ty3-G Gag-Pol polyprotein [Folsomia candida]
MSTLHGLQPLQRAEISSLLNEFPAVMSEKIGRTTLTQCELTVTDNPIAQRAYRVSPHKRTLITQHVKKMLELGIIRESNSPWASPINLVKQGDEYRCTLDYRKLNKCIPNDPFYIPHMDSLLERLGPARFFTKIDLRKGYWQIAMHPDSIKYTAFICHEGKYEFLRMPFGLSIAVAKFQRFVNNLLKNARGVFADAYLDDIIIYSSTWKEHLKHVRFVLEQLQAAGLTANVAKCSFGLTTISYLGFIISPDGVSTDPRKTSSILEFPIPHNPKEVKRFLGLCGWYRHFIKHFSSKSEPLNALLRGTQLFIWGEAQQKAFDLLKQELIHTVTLALPDFHKPFVLRTDASGVGLGAVLSNRDLDGTDRPIAFASRSLSHAERNYDGPELEGLAIIYAFKKFEHYLDGREFHLETDARALTYIHKHKDVNSKIMRWALRIQDFQFTVSHIAGTQNVVADALSRAPTDPPHVDELEDHMLVPTNSTFLALLQAPVTPLLTLPAIRTAQDADPEVQALLTDLPESFSLSDGILYKNGKNTARLPFIPQAMRRSVLHFFHDSPLAGHLGYRKTMARLLRRVFWFGMHEDIYAYIRSCATCQAVKNPTSKPHGSLQSVLPQGPWDMLAMDLMGPLPRSANRNTYLLVVVDHFSKWVELFALKDATAPLIARTLEREIFCRFGAPASILSDNATNFRGKVLANLMKAWGIEQKFTTTYHPQGNITERVNRNLRAMLSAYTHSKHSKWDEFLPETALALRTAVHSSTGFSPALLNLGREPKLPLDYAVNPVHSDGFDSRIDYSTKLIDRLASLYSQAKLNIEKSCEEQKRHYDKRHKNITFKPNDLVLLKTHHLSKKSEKFSKKLAIRWDGPFRIVAQLTPVTYTIVKMVPDAQPTIHNVKHLKPFFDRPSHLSDYFACSSPENISMSDITVVESSDQGHSYHLRSRNLLV